MVADRYPPAGLHALHPAVDHLYHPSAPGHPDTRAPHERESAIHITRGRTNHQIAGGR